jgi:hypothetical protein
MRLALFIACFCASIVASGIALATGVANQRYSSQTYGFSVEIPPHLNTETTPPPAPQHGIAITLSSAGHVWIDASYDASFLGSATAALRDLAADESVTPPPPLDAMRLSGLAAARLHYTRDGKVAVRVIAFRPRSGEVAILYTFGLDTDNQHAGQDERTFDLILRSFVLLPLPK